MGFLHKLWDETLAGPTPDTGLGKLRKYDSFSASRSPPTLPLEVPITRSITIVRTNSNFRSFSSDPTSLPDSPCGSTTPRTPSTPGTPVGDFKKFTRRKSSVQADSADHTSRDIYDWFCLFCCLVYEMTYMAFASLTISDSGCLPILPCLQGNYECFGSLKEEVKNTWQMDTFCTQMRDSKGNILHGIDVYNINSCRWLATYNKMAQIYADYIYRRSQRFMGS